MKKLLLSVAVAAATFAAAQTGNVGINTTAPATTLDVTGVPTDTTKLDGITAPRLTGDQLRAKTYTTAQTGALVYATAADSAPAGQTVKVTTPGYYYFDGSVWQVVSSGAASGSYTAGEGITITGNTIAQTGLKQVTQSGKTGWRLIGVDESLYGDTGNGAVTLTTSDQDLRSFGGDFVNGIGALGERSFAAGYGTVASAIGSAAIGTQTSASGPGAIALGQQNTASGSYSFVAGGQGDKAVGNNSVAIGGSNSVANGQSSLAMMGGITAAGADNSVAIGISSTSHSTNASGIASLAMMGGNASGKESIAIGRNAIASGLRSLALGTESGYALNDGAIAINGSANGINSAAFTGVAFGQQSIALGGTANGSYSTAIGYFGVSTGQYSLGLMGSANGDYQIGLGTTQHKIMIGGGIALESLDVAGNIRVRSAATGVGNAVTAGTNCTNLGTISFGQDGNFYGCTGTASPGVWKQLNN